jgi:uncharacterized protein with NAD-binding domain and iron-sulfur cluster
VTRNRGRVAILGGGVAGLSAAWRLSEPGWRDRFDSITVYQRGWRLGGKGASSRGPHGRIEEHGLHVWLGCYDNAFALLRECYSELDRATTDPESPIRSWDQAFIPSDHMGIADRFGEEWLVWPGSLARNDELPGEPNATGREFTAVEFLRRALQLVLSFADSLSAFDEQTDRPPDSSDSTGEWLQVVRWGVLAMQATLAKPFVHESIPSGGLSHVLDAIREALDYEDRPDHRRFWLFLSLETATVRGIISDNLVTDPRGFRAINDEDFCAWILRHGAHPDVVDFPLVRGLYDMVFGYEDGDFTKPALGAGVALLLTGIALFQYKGAFFWKMTAGMGDVVIAPLYQALRRRGVQFEFFHRVDALHLDKGCQAIEAITIGRQGRLIEPTNEYEPLIRVGGLSVFPDRPLEGQLDGQAPGDLESHFGERADVETRVLRRGVDFEHVVLAASLGMVELVAGELIADSPQWRDMTTKLRTVATQAFQLWLHPDEPALGWHRPGVTTSGYVAPFDTWASMPQTLWTEQWPVEAHPGTVAYFCGALNALWPTTEEPRSYVTSCRAQVVGEAVAYLDNHVGLYLPGAVTEQGFAWNLLVGAEGHEGVSALETQYVSVNIDPSDRYVQSVPGSDKYRLRSDESGYENLVLAGDWTDCGFNAGCIEAAVMSGLQAANALLGRGHRYRIRGFYQP